MLDFNLIFTADKPIPVCLKTKREWVRGERYGLSSDAPWLNLRKESFWPKVILGSPESPAPWYAKYVEGQTKNMLASNDPKKYWVQYVRFAVTGTFPVTEFFADGKQVTSTEAKKWMPKEERSEEPLTHIFTKVENVIWLAPEGMSPKITPENAVVADTETSRLGTTAEVINFGAVSKEGEIELFMNPTESVDSEAAKVNGYSPEEWSKRHAVAMIEGLQRAFSAIDGKEVVFHNAAFDIPILMNAFQKFLGKMPAFKAIFCTLHESRIRFNSQKNNLSAVCERLGVTLQGAHGALADARATSEVLVKFMA
jgi:hypothetical protein